MEEERTGPGETAPNLTVFLAGAECPFTCVFCDLWRHTLDGPTPPGALPKQLEQALAAAEAELPRSGWHLARLKLYNASNFFDERAVPAVDEEALAALGRPFERVVVECHPRLVGERCFRFSEKLRVKLGVKVGTKLEVAMGLETVHPEAFPLLNKGTTLAEHDAAARALAEDGIALRSFVLLGTPYVSPEEDLHWTLRSVEHALGLGAEQVSIIPLRPGNGAVEALMERGEAVLPGLRDLEDALRRALVLAESVGGGVVTADLWDAESLEACPSCRPARLANLERMNRTGQPGESLDCETCEEGDGS